MAKESSVIEYVILGTSHWVQESSDLERALVAAATKHGVHLIAEENAYDIDTTSARRAASWQGINYLQVDPPPAEWAGLGIEREMDLRNQCLQAEDVRLSHADAVREGRWLEKIEASLEHGRVLVVCGYLHVDFFAEKVEKNGGRILEKSFFPAELGRRKPAKVLSLAQLEEQAKRGHDSEP